MRAIELNGVGVEANKRSFLWGRRAAVDMKRVEKVAFPSKAIVVQMPQSLDNLINSRTAFLTEYQDAAYAERYLQLVNKVKSTEASLGLGNRLSMAVARYYFKLMAYKDEYEVARLYTDGKFIDKVKEQFEGDFSIRFNLAPPLLAEKDAQGHFIKAEYGSWVFSAFKLLAKAKGLRGGMFDIFGRTAERKMERQLIVEYADMLQAILPTLNADNISLVIQLASLPEQIRGYGHVKEKAVEQARQRQAQLLAELKGGGGMATVRAG